MYQSTSEEEKHLNHWEDCNLESLRGTRCGKQKTKKQQQDMSNTLH